MSVILPRRALLIRALHLVWLQFRRLGTHSPTASHPRTLLSHWTMVSLAFLCPPPCNACSCGRRILPMSPLTHGPITNPMC
ncbi:hypothetical protein C8R47DRAFT_1119448 [Mycena vitilis]|nr:hypothetical protein C8R47DRAFT_1119448 [Mycena vitilis]